MKISTLFFLTLCTFLMASCDDYLDRKLDTTYTEEQVFSSYGTMRDFGLGIYTYLPEGFNRIDSALLSAASDESVHSGTGTVIQRLNNGSWGAFNNPDDQWARFYEGIRKATLFLDRSVDFKHIVYRDTLTVAGKNTYDYETNDLRWLRAEARFLRAYFYFELIKRYGGVPLITEVLTPGESPSVTRDSYEDCVDFIVTELDDSEDELRNSWAGFDGDKYIGRATLGAARALKARTLLYAASILNNPFNDLEKWEQAAVAAHDVISLNRYSLAGNYRDLFRAMQSSEFIFEKRYKPANSLERNSYPLGFSGATGGTNPSQNLVDAYETTNGLSIADDPAYDPQNPFTNRDPRMLMTIIVNNATYKGRAVEIWPGGKDGPGKLHATRTGYYLKKFVDENIDLIQGKTSAHAWIYFRYAEVLLNYAEAMNEAYGPDDVPAGFTLSARAALNRVRKRNGVNMPDVVAVTKDEFREKVRNERRIELAFEEHRFWDVRRWKIGEEMLGSDIFGMKVILNDDDTFTYEYPSTPVERRVFEEKMYRYPIPRSEIDKTSGAITQNTGW
jgi:starch-binding outer membrane protein, SusD/RagB family